MMRTVPMRMTPFDDDVRKKGPNSSRLANSSGWK